MVYFILSAFLTLICIVAFSVVYPIIVWGVAQFSPNKGNGFLVTAGGKSYYANIAQKFTADKYFWPRPSAVDYNASGSGGSNKGPNNPEYLADVQKRIDTFMVHNPGISKADIPSDLVTASGSGLDPDVSVQGAKVQVKRVAAARHLPEEKVAQIVAANIEKPLLGILGPEKVNVLQLNIALDQIK